MESSEQENAVGSRSGSGNLTTSSTSTRQKSSETDKNPPPREQPQPYVKRTWIDGRTFNPCFCCLSCNIPLRSCVIVIAIVVLSIAAYIIASAVLLESDEDCRLDLEINSSNSTQNGTSTPTGPRVIECSNRSESNPEEFLFFLVSGFIYGVAGTVLLIAVFARWAPGALIAAGAMIIGTLVLVAFANHRQAYNPDTHHKKGNEDLSYIVSLQAITIQICLWIWPLLFTYFVICTIAMYLQIRAKKDLDPVQAAGEPANAQVMDPTPGYRDNRNHARTSAPIISPDVAPGSSSTDSPPPNP